MTDSTHHSELLTFEALCAWTGYEKPTAVRRWLDDHQVPCWENKHGQPITLASAVREALGVEPADPPVEFR
jgi:hypothetical protein